MSLRFLWPTALVTALVSGLVTGPQPVFAAATPALDHVVVIVMENRSYSEIIGSTAAPYLNSLGAAGAVAQNYHAVAHPSLPNYLALTGGSTFGITSDCTACFLNAPNLGDRLESAGRTWRAYMDGMPSPCFAGDSYPYMQKHDPFYYFDDIRTNAARCEAHVVPFSSFGSDFASASTTPALAWITPDMCNDMHDCTVAAGDAWLQLQVPGILGSPAFKTQRSALFIVWDEDDGSASNQVALLATGPAVRPGYASTVAYDHYSLLRTVEATLGAGTLTAADAGATPMSDLLVAAPVTSRPAVSGAPAAAYVPRPGVSVQVHAVTVAPNLQTAGIAPAPTRTSALSSERVVPPTDGALAGDSGRRGRRPDQAVLTARGWCW